jgi:flagellar hook-basal body complex protein FliE
MTAPIGAIGAMVTGATAAVVRPPSVLGPVGATAAQASTPTGPTGFAGALSNGLAAVAGSQANADGLAVKAATGTLNDVHAYMIASTQASLTTELATTLRNKAVDAFNEIMRMQA